MYNIGKKTVKHFKVDIDKYTSYLQMKENMLQKGIAVPERSALMDVVNLPHKTAAEHLKKLETLLPKSAKLHVNTLYEACLTTQSACMAFQGALQRATDDMGYPGDDNW